jgi:hypothetical protein
LARRVNRLFAIHQENQCAFFPQVLLTFSEHFDKQSSHFGAKLENARNLACNGKLWSLLLLQCKQFA